MEKPLLLLGMNPDTVPREQIQRMLDQARETGRVPGPDGRCTQDDCGGQVVWRNWPEGSAYRPSPSCLRCGAAYRNTPSGTQLPLYSPD